MARGIGIHSVKYYRKAVDRLEDACKILANEFPVDYVECIVTLRDAVRKMVEG